jgi:chromosome segregation ATPase
MRVLVVLLLVTAVSATTEGEGNRANPIRRVVTMLQNMQKKVVAEGEKEKELFDKYMCYCKTSGEDLKKSIADNEEKAANLPSEIEEAEAKKKQLDEDVKQAQEDRAAAKKAMAEATALREKEAAEYAKASADDKVNLEGITGAVAAIEKGMAGAFLQTPVASMLKKLAEKRQENDVVAFLEGSASEGYAPSSGEIVGILKQMHDEITVELKDITKVENERIAAYDKLMAAKAKEVAALTKAIEEKLERSGALAVEIVQMKNDLGNVDEQIAEDKKFLADLDKNCKTKAGEWEEIVKTRNEELLALADTIKILNDDDSLELFKKTLPSPAPSLMQLQVTSASMRSRALAAIRAAPRSAHLDFIALAIHGKKIGFDKVITMIDEMVATLKTEQADDDKKKEYCEKEFDTADDKKKSLEHTIKNLDTEIEDTKEGISTVTDEIAALQASIKALDKAVAEATEQRKEEHEDFVNLMAQDSAAKELLAFARNRLNKFYNPKLYEAPPKRELTEEDRATLAAGGTLPPTPTPGGIAGTGITVLADVSEHGVAKPPPPPEAPGAFVKKTEESNGVITMIDLLVKDLDKEMTVAETEEKDAQADYEEMMADAKEKHAEDVKVLENKEATLADLKAALEKQTDEKTAATQELANTGKYIASLHAECDWLVQYFDVRAEARASEVDALGNAKAVLSGADYSLVQTNSKHFLKRA